MNRVALEITLNELYRLMCEHNQTLPKDAEVISWVGYGLMVWHHEFCVPLANNHLHHDVSFPYQDDFPDYIVGTTENYPDALIVGIKPFDVYQLLRTANPTLPDGALVIGVGHEIYTNCLKVVIQHPALKDMGLHPTQFYTCSFMKTWHDIIKASILD